MVLNSKPEVQAESFDKRPDEQAMDLVDAGGPKESTATGSRSVSIGGNSFHTIVSTGDYSQIFVGDYQRLKDAYIDPRSVFERVTLDRFIGRTWLKALVDSFIERNERGYLVIEAPAGFGKTTFAAHLVKERGYIHHFVELAPGSDGLATGLRSLVAQIVGGFRLNPNRVDEVVPGAANRPDYLQTLLFEAVEAQSKDKIVIVIDGTDEAGLFTGMNVLGLPKILPKGVFFILTQRPVRVPLYVDSPREVFRFEVNDERNLSDMRAFLESVALGDPFSSLIAGSVYTAEQFVEVLLSKCEGLWIYLHYVLSEIELGERSPLDLSSLPQGIWQYYAQYWQRLRDEAGADWNQIYLPVLATMAAAQEGLPFEWLCLFAGVNGNEGLRRLLTETWRPFIAGSRDENQEFRLYHASLREFFDGRSNADRLTTQENSLAVELSKATAQAHSRIANYYLMKWGGLENGLPSLGRAEDELYGARHIVSHLDRAGRTDEVHNLLRLERAPTEDRSQPADSIALALREKWSPFDGTPRSIRVRPINHWYAFRESRNDTSGYLSDVSRAWQIAMENAGARDFDSGLALQLRYALITASLHSLAGRIPAPLIVASVQKGVWSESQAVIIARHMTDPKHRAEALILLLPFLPANTAAEVKTEALFAVISIPYKADPEIDHESERVKLFIELAKFENEPGARDRIFDEALSNCRRVEKETIRGRALKLLVPHFPHRVEEILSAAREIADLNVQMDVICELIPILPEKLMRTVLNQILNLGSPNLRTLMLNEIIMEPPLVTDVDLIREALSSGKTIEGAHQKVQALSRLLPALKEDEKLAVANEMSEAARHAADEYLSLWLLSELPLLLHGHVSEETMANRVQEAIEAARKLEHVMDRAVKLERLIPFVPEDQKDSIQDEVMAMIRTEPSESSRVSLLQIISYHAPPNKKLEALCEALDLAFSISDSHDRERMLSDLIPSFNVEGGKNVLKTLVSFSVPAPAKQVSPTILGQALVVASERELYNSHSLSFIDLLSMIPAASQQMVLQEALVAGLSMLGSNHRNRALNAICSHLTAETIRAAVKAVQEVGDEYQIGSALAMLQVFPSEGAVNGVIEGVIESADAMHDASRALNFLLPVAAKVTGDERARLLDYTLSLIQSISDNDKRTHALVRAVSVLTSDIKEEFANRALNGIDEMEDDRARLNNLMPLLPHLPGKQKEKAVEESFNLARSIVDAEQKTSTMRNLIPHLSDSQRIIAVNEGVAAAQTIAPSGKKARTLSILLPYVEEEDKATVLAEAMTSALASNDESDRSWSLRALLSHASANFLSDILAIAVVMKQVMPKAELLTGLLQHFPAKGEEIYEETLKACDTANDEGDKTVILMSIANSPYPYNMNDLVLRAGQLSGHGRAYVLSTLIKNCDPDNKIGLVTETVQAIRSIANQSDRATVVLYLTPFLVQELKQIRMPNAALGDTVPVFRAIQSLFEESMHIFASKTRHEMLREMDAIAAAVLAISGENTIEEIARAIRDVGRWWP